jgi:hypothetical protein
MFAGMRLIVGIGGALLFALGLLLLVAGTPDAFPLLVAGAVGIVAAVWDGRATARWPPSAATARRGRVAVSPPTVSRRGSRAPTRCSSTRPAAG